ncbi:hypothetical protein BJ166DRAFT_358345 [Pestalotiopsis sp. NC0098]|nr:hypothetical protein BJ166DRAFT_358345 [Pestalotiopsis sp. NC0098]
MIKTFLTMIYLLTIVNVFLQDWAAFLFDSVTMFHLRVLYNTERRGLGGCWYTYPTQPQDLPLVFIPWICPPSLSASARYEPSNHISLLQSPMMHFHILASAS